MARSPCRRCCVYLLMIGVDEKLRYSGMILLILYISDFKARIGGI